MIIKQIYNKKNGLISLGRFDRNKCMFRYKKQNIFAEQMNFQEEMIFAEQMNHKEHNKIRVVSDLHLEFGLKPIEKCEKICKLSPTKYTVLAGDITDYPNKNTLLPKLFSKIRTPGNEIIYILGNHEYYNKGSKSSSEIINEYKELCIKENVKFLENETYETDDYIFYGTTLWSDFAEHAYNRMNDHNFLSLPQIKELYINSVNSLTDFVSQEKFSQIPKKVVVITHHLPSFNLIDQKYRKYTLLNTAFASSLDHLIKPPVNIWIYGHTHSPRITDIGSVKLVCNPHGYPNETYIDTDYYDIVV